MTHKHLPLILPLLIITLGARAESCRISLTASTGDQTESDLADGIAEPSTPSENLSMDPLPGTQTEEYVKWFGSDGYMNKGGVTEYDDDGIPKSVIEVDGSTTTWTHFKKGANSERCIHMYQRTTDTPAYYNSYEYVDRDCNGQPEKTKYTERIAREVAQPTDEPWRLTWDEVTIKTEDTNGDGIYDHRYTWTLEANQRRVTRERGYLGSDGHQAYTLEYESPISPFSHAINTNIKNTTVAHLRNYDTCDTSDNDIVASLRTALTSVSIVDPLGKIKGTSFKVVEEGTGRSENRTGLFSLDHWACSTSEIKIISDALDRVVSESISCMAATNNEISSKLYSAINKGATLVCNLPCPKERMAGTMKSSSIIALTSSFFALSSIEKWSTILHEILHLAGQEHEDPGLEGINPNRPEERERVDTVYACGRFCAGCQTLKGVGTRDEGPAPDKVGHSSDLAWDCARCADADTRPHCGLKSGTPHSKHACTISGPKSQMTAVCEGGDPTGCISLRAVYCDNSKSSFIRPYGIDNPTSVCAEACPPPSGVGFLCEYVATHPLVWQNHCLESSVFESTIHEMCSAGQTPAAVDGPSCDEFGCIGLPGAPKR